MLLFIVFASSMSRRGRTISCVATGLGSLLAPLRPGRLECVPQSFRSSLPAGIAAARCDGALHLCLDPTDAGKVSLPLVRRSSGRGGVGLSLSGISSSTWWAESSTRNNFRRLTFRLEVGVALVLLYCSFYFYSYAHRKNSLAFTLLAMSLALWSVLMLFGQFSNSSYSCSICWDPFRKCPWESRW